MIIEDEPIDSPSLGYEKDHEIGAIEAATDAARVVFNEDWSFSSKIAEARYADDDNPNMVNNVYDAMVFGRRETEHEHIRAMALMDSTERYDYMTEVMGVEVDPVYSEEQALQMSQDYADAREKAAATGEARPVVAGVSSVATFIADPMNVALGGASSALKAGKGLSFAQRLMAASGENMAVEALLQEQVYDHKQVIGSPYSSSDVALAIAGAGAGGAVFESLGTIIKRVRKSPALKDAGATDQVARDLELLQAEVKDIPEGRDLKALDELDSVAREEELALPRGERVEEIELEVKDYDEVQLKSFDSADPEIKADSNRIASITKLQECLVG